MTTLKAALPDCGLKWTWQYPKSVSRWKWRWIAYFTSTLYIPLCVL